MPDKNSVRLLTSQDLPAGVQDVIGTKEIYAIGATDLLKRPCVGLCGSRDASDDALNWAYEFGKETAKRDIVLVSGYARGVDRLAHKGVLEAGGATIAVLPEGIEHFKMIRELRPLIDVGSNFLALSMFKPQDTWQVWRAMERNKLIVGLSSDLFVIEAKERGGTIAAAYEAIRQHKRLWAVAYKEATSGRKGNKLLLAGKAMPVKHIDDFRAALEDAMREPPSEVRQLVMAVMNDTEKGA